MNHPIVSVNAAFETLDLPTALASVSPERRDAALGYRRESDRKLSVAVYLLLKEILRAEFGIRGNSRLVIGPNGKPFLADHPGVHFNFSHCPRAAACAVFDRPVGLDIEAIRPIDEAVARRVLSDDEWREMQEAEEPEIVFVRYWTMKEALLKLNGEGLGSNRLTDLLASSSDVDFQTSVNRAQGYVCTTAWRVR